MINNDFNSVLNFIFHCNEFINGKFLFSSLKVKEIYLAMQDSHQINDLVVQCENDFKYSLQMTKSFIKTPTKNGYFVAPEEPDKFIALCYNLFKNISEQKIDFDSFLLKYFLDDKLSINANFAKKIIVPLRDMIADYFDLEKENETFFKIEEPEQKTVQSNTVEDKSNVFAEIIPICENLIVQIKDLNIKRETKNFSILILGEMIKSCRRKDEENLYALMIGLFKMKNQLKTVSHLFDELNFVLKKF